MTNHEHPSKSEPDQPDQADRPYSELTPATQTYLEAIATGHIDPSTVSIEDLHELDSLLVNMYDDMKSLVYEYLSDHDELPPLTGLPPELQQMAQLFETQYHNGIPPGLPPYLQRLARPFENRHYNGTPPQPPDIAPPSDTPPSPETPQ